MAEDIDSPLEVVIDALVLLSRFLPDENTSDEISVLFRKYEAGKVRFLAPEVLKYEIANSLRSGVLQKRLSLKLAQELLTTILLLTIYYIETDFQQTLDLAVKNKISVYDASYVVLAKKHKTKLVTLDDKLAEIARNLDK